MSLSGAKSAASACCASRSVASVQGWPSTAASARAARFTVAAMPPKAKRTALTTSPSKPIARPAQTAEMSQSKRLEIL